VKTRTILSAYAKTIAALASDPTVPRKWYQRQAFERELLRRMDERDALRTQNARILGNLQIAWQNNTNLARKLYNPEGDSK